MKKFGFGAVWFLVISMGFLMTGVFVAGAIAGANDPANASAAGKAAGEAFHQYDGIIILTALTVSFIGTALGWLPGTKTKKQEL